MRAWAYMLGGLLVWTAHFFLLYGAASIFQTSDTTRWITAVVTFFCLAIAAWLAVKGWKGRQAEEDRFSRWSHWLASITGAGAFIAVLWQGLPAILI
jgi:hypothetical protein